MVQKKPQWFETALQIKGSVIAAIYKRVLLCGVSFTLLGIEAIGLEIENPFGYDENDLPLDAICTTMKRNIDDLISLTPTVHKS
jgi:putative membrane protein